MAFCFWLVPVTKVQMTLFNRRSGCFFLYKTFELVLPSSPPPPLLSIGNSSSSPVSSINWRTKLSRTYSHQIIHSDCIITFQILPLEDWNLTGLCAGESSAAGRGIFRKASNVAVKFSWSRRFAPALSSVSASWCLRPTPSCREWRRRTSSAQSKEFLPQLFTLKWEIATFCRLPG